MQSFQMSYASKAGEDERMSWCTVIHLNLIGSINTTLDALEYAPETAVCVNLLWTETPDASQSAVPRVARPRDASCARPGRGRGGACNLRGRDPSAACGSLRALTKWLGCRARPCEEPGAALARGRGAGGHPH